MIHGCRKTRALEGEVGAVRLEEEKDEARSASGSCLDSCMSGGDGEELLSVMNTSNKGVVEQMKKVADMAR